MNASIKAVANDSYAEAPQSIESKALTHIVNQGIQAKQITFEDGVFSLAKDAPADFLKSLSAAALSAIRRFSASDTFVDRQFESVAAYLRELKAGTEAIAAKYARYANVLGKAITAIEFGGKNAEIVFQKFEHGAIYVTPRGTFEVHGEIYRKYAARGAENGILGFPTTDESGTPDGKGAYNHFDGGSIYFTSRTGPMIVRGTVRDRWAASGWERGPLGYPVQDQYRMHLRGPTPLIEWCRFENGLIAGDVRGGMPVPMALQSPAETLGRFASPASLTYQQLADFIGARINAQFQASPDNVHLRAGVALTGVSDWKYGFSESVRRSVGFRLRGFHDNGYAPDTNFYIDLRLSFELISSASFTEPVMKTLIATLVDHDVGHDGGLALAQVYAGVDSGILHAFYGSDDRPHDPEHPEVPSGSIFIADVPTGANAVTGEIDVLDVMITSAGELQVLVNPLTPPQTKSSEVSFAYLRQLAVQNILNGLV
jgi:hypothetical protein